MTEVMSVDQVVAELRDVLEVSRGNPTLSQRLAGGELTVLYEFQLADGAVEPWVLTVGRQTRSLEPGTVGYDDADIVIRTEPLTLHRLTSGALRGREAIVSGKLDIRKAPSLAKLLMMRGLFNHYKKANATANWSPTTPSDCAVLNHYEKANTTAEAGTTAEAHGTRKAQTGDRPPAG